MNSGKVLLVPAGNDACKHYRFSVPAAHPSVAPHVAWPQDHLDPSTLRSTLDPRSLGGYQSIVFQRPCTPSVTTLIEGLTGLSPMAHRPLVVVELDDALWDVNQYVDPFRFYTPDRLDALVRNLRRADRIVVATPYLRWALSEELGIDKGKIYVVPIVLPHDFMFPEAGTVQLRPNRVLFSGGSSHHDDVHKAFRLVDRLDEPFTFTSVGHDFSLLVRRHESVHHGWVDSVDEHYRNLRLNYSGQIGLSPLSGRKFNNGKSPTRLIEYAACGIIPVYSDHLVHLSHPTPLFAGGVVPAPHDWRRVTREMLNASKEHKLDVVARNLELVQRSYTLTEGMARHWHSVWSGEYQQPRGN